MPLLGDIAIAQPCLQNPALSAKFAFSQCFFFANDDTRQFPNPQSLRVVIIKAAFSTLEPHSSLHNTFQLNHLNSTEFQQLNFNSTQVQPEEKADEFDEREKLIRMRISKANTGNTPWNKGRKHTPETLQRIRERTKIAMQNPKIRQKLASLRHAQSTETRVKIGEGVRLGWQRRRGKMTVQETCHFEWQNFLAEASKRGIGVQDELQWNSHQILSEQLEQEWIESVELRKSMLRTKDSNRAPKSLEQRRKIAQAVAAKWADPDYRERVCSGLAKYYGTTIGAGRKPRRSPGGITQTKRREQPVEKAKSENKSQNEWLKLCRSKTPRCKDPQISSKLEMIKNIRAQRVVEETKVTEAIERARLLISEAEKAAIALEVAVMKNPIAQASLVETRKLIAEAIQSIEPIETIHTVSNENEIVKGNGDYTDTKVNGSSLASREDEGIDLRSFNLKDILKGEHELLSTSTARFDLLSLCKEQLEPDGNVKCGMKFQVNGKSMKERTLAQPNTSTKKWVHGRLVEVAEGE